MPAQPVQVQFPGYGRFMADLALLSPEIRKETRAELRKIMEDVGDTARSKASWSSRIPGAIKASVGTKNLGLTVRAADAPHAKAYEGLASGGSRSSFRHPVYGNRNVWVTQSTRPFAMPALAEREDEALRRVEDALESAARRLGFAAVG